jgi:hypothetical protein
MRCVRLLIGTLVFTAQMGMTDDNGKYELIYVKTIDGWSQSGMRRASKHANGLGHGRDGRGQNGTATRVRRVT